MCLVHMYLRTSTLYLYEHTKRMLVILFFSARSSNTILGRHIIPQGHFIAVVSLIVLLITVIGLQLYSYARVHRRIIAI